MNGNFYYIDEEGNKKKYVGKIESNPDGTYSGLLTKVIRTIETKDLIYHEEIPEVKAHPAYYSYINSLGEEVLYLVNVKKDEDGNPYFTYTEKNLFKLDYVPGKPGNDEYFTYLDKDGIEQKYDGSIIKKGKKYSGFIKQ